MSSARDGSEAAGQAAMQLLRAPGVDALGMLKSLNIGKCDLSELPDSLTRCQMLEKLEISGNKHLQQLPAVLASLPKLRILFAAGIGLESIPPHLADCKRLRMLSVKENTLTCIDGDCLPEDIMWLIAASNKISSLPNIARLKHIRKLMLSNNLLTCETLAPIAGIDDLEMIRVAENKLEAFPEVLLTHKKLAWVAIGSNPFTEAAMQKRLEAVPPMMDFTEVQQGERLGSGAGATVYKAEWRGQSVALKLWEGVRASDGTAVGEWGANCVAGDPGDGSLVRVHGVFKEPLGMAMELLEGAVQAASPPSFDTCTRDLLPKQGGKGPTYTAASALIVARAVAQACAYLRTKGVLHGDVYLHNTLVVIKDDVKVGASVNDARLSDFGAAAVCEEPLLSGLEKLEVRTYGWLLQDLLESLAPPIPDDGALPSEVVIMKDLRARCGAESAEEVPTFRQVVEAFADSKDGSLKRKFEESIV